MALILPVMMQHICTVFSGLSLSRHYQLTGIQLRDALGRYWLLDSISLPPTNDVIGQVQHDGMIVHAPHSFVFACR